MSDAQVEEYKYLWEKKKMITTMITSSPPGKEGRSTYATPKPQFKPPPVPPTIVNTSEVDTAARCMCKQTNVEKLLI